MMSKSSRLFSCFKASPLYTKTTSTETNEMREEICKALNSPVQYTFMWTYRTTVLQRLNPLDKQTLFVVNRVSGILYLTSVHQWHHAASHKNPADASHENPARGMSSEELQESSWLHDPTFLRTSDFPFQPNTHVVKNIN